MTGAATRAGAGALVALLLAGCGGSGEDSPAPADGPAATASVADPAPLGSQAPLPATAGGTPLTAAQLEAALLPVTALPAGFSADPPDPAGSGDAAPDPAATQVGTSDPAACAALLAPVATFVPDPTGRADAGFTGADAFTTVTQDVGSWAGDGALAALTAVRGTAAACSSFTSVDADGVLGSYRVGAVEGLDVTGLGDGATALRLVGTSEGVAVVFDVVVVVAGSSAVQLVAAGLEPVAPDGLRAAAASAVDRLRDAQR